MDKSSDAVPIPPIDRDRIESMVASFRSSLETIYALAYVQGQMDQADETRRNRYAETMIRRDRLIESRPEHDTTTHGTTLRPGS